MDGKGRPEVIYRLLATNEHLECHEPRPFESRPRERIIPSRVDLSDETARCSWPTSTTAATWKASSAAKSRSCWCWNNCPCRCTSPAAWKSISMGGTFTLARILGTVPVEEDGSAFFEVPALRSLFFVALDENDLSVKRMQSFVTVQPGETTGCVGCHEQRTETIRADIVTDLMAYSRRPAKSTRSTTCPRRSTFRETSSRSSTATASNATTRTATRAASI